MIPLRRTRSVIALTIAGMLGLVACASADLAEDAATIAPHDGVDGGAAAEVAAPASALIVAGADGEALLLDLDSEERSALDTDGTLQAATGRYLHVVGDAGARTSVQIVDSGRWTMPHGDHSHSFLGETRALDAVEGEGDVRITVGDDRTALLFGGEDLAVLDHDTVQDGHAEPARLAFDDMVSLVLPFSGHLLVATGTHIDVLDPAGAVVTAQAALCTSPSDADITRVGAVFACAEGAVLVTREVGGALVAESIPSPGDAPAPVQLSGRADRPDLAGIAGDAGAWLFDSRERGWTLIPTDAPVVAVSALGDDDGRVVAVAEDGTVRILSPDGVELSRTPVAGLAANADVHVLLTARHAYVTDPDAGAIHEIDLDDGSISRTFEDLDPRTVQLVG